MISRRRLLRLGGLTALGTGWPGGVLHALAQPAASPPRRLVVISHCHGWPYAAWRMRPAGMPESQPWSLDLTSLDERELSAPLAPLYPHRRRLLVLDGLSLATAELDAGDRLPVARPTRGVGALAFRHPPADLIAQPGRAFPLVSDQA